MGPQLSVLIAAAGLSSTPAEPVSRPGQSPLSIPSPHAEPGDMSLRGLFQPQQGKPDCYINPYTNDVFGHTDKINSHSVSGGCALLLTVGDRPIGLTSQVTWRLVTPITKVSRQSALLDEPIGSYADWLESETTAAGFSGPFYFQAAVSVSHIGPKGGAEVQRLSHELIGQNRQFEWEPQERRWAIGGGLEMGLGFQATAPRSILLEGGPFLRSGVGFSQSLLLRELYSSTQLQVHVKPGLEVILYLVASRVAQSELFPSHPEGRLEFGSSLRWFENFSSSISQGQPWVSGDRHPQVIVTPLAFFLTFD